ncbi:MAG: hypothetical protein ABJ360_22875 [Roseobacter sp.]
MSFIGLSKIVGAGFEAERSELWQAMFPNIECSPPKGVTEEELWSATHKKWRNAWCDVHTIWAHIDAGRDVFVTANERDFQHNFEKLQMLGLKKVATPAEALLLANEPPHGNRSRD